MEGSNVSARGGGWKHSVIKNNPTDSRIFGEHKDLPVKFSPAKYAEQPGLTSKSLVRSKILSYSQDEIIVGNQRDRSNSKERSLAKRPAPLKTPRSIKAEKGEKGEEVPELKLGLQVNSSERSLSALLNSPKRRRTIDNNTIEFVHELKMQYMRFKQKMLGELKKLQKDIKNAVEDIMNTLSSLTRQSNSKVVRFASQEGNPPSFGLSFDSPIAITRNLPKVVLPEMTTVDTSKYRDLLSSESAMQSMLPKIKQRMSKFFQIMGQLKCEINEQAMYSPVRMMPFTDSPQREEMIVQ